MSIETVKCEYLGHNMILKASTASVAPLVYATNIYDTDTILIAGGHYGEGIEYMDYLSTVIKFKIPKIPLAISKKLTVLLPVYSISNDNPLLNYAVTTSDKNYEKYCNVYGKISDEYQVTTGTVSRDDCLYLDDGDLSTFTLTIDTEKLKENTTYYLFLWAATSNVKASITFKHLYPMRFEPQVVLEYICGAVYINDGVNFQMHQCFIDNGNGWDLYVPYIDNGTSWEIYS